MPGIYSRDNFAQLLAAAIENAQARRQAFVDREAARTNSNVQAIGNFAKALGRTYETWDGKSDEDKLAALQKEREEAIKAKQERDDYLRGMLNREQPSGPSTNEYYAQAMQGYTPATAYSNQMQGYVPTEAMYASRPNYSEILKKRGIYQ